SSLRFDEALEPPFRECAVILGNHQVRSTGSQYAVATELRHATSRRLDQNLHVRSVKLPQDLACGIALRYDRNHLCITTLALRRQAGERPLNRGHRLTDGNDYRNLGSGGHPRFNL